MDAFQWVLAGATILGALVGLPPLLQHFLGGPKIRFEPGEELRSDRGLCLVLKVRNLPIRSRPLRLLRLRRVPAECLSASVEVREDSTNRLLAAARPPVRLGDTEEAPLRLPGGDTPAFLVVCWARSADGALACDDVHGRPHRRLAAGRYVAHVVLDWEGGRLELARSFDVSCAGPRLSWVD